MQYQQRKTKKNQRDTTIVGLPASFARFPSTLRYYKSSDFAITIRAIRRMVRATMGRPVYADQIFHDVLRELLTTGVATVHVQEWRYWKKADPWKHQENVQRKKTYAFVLQSSHDGRWIVDTHDPVIAAKYRQTICTTPNLVQYERTTPTIPRLRGEFRDVETPQDGMTMLSWGHL